MSAFDAADSLFVVVVAFGHDGIASAAATTEPN